MSKSGWSKRYPILSEEFENEKKKEQFFLTFRSGDLNPRFSCPRFEFSWKVRSLRSNQNKLLKEIGLYNEISLTFNEQNVYFIFSLIIPTQIHTWRQPWQNYMLSVHRISQTITELKSSVYPISQNITEWRENQSNMLQLNMQVYF